MTLTMSVDITNEIIPTIPVCAPMPPPAVERVLVSILKKNPDTEPTSGTNAPKKKVAFVRRWRRLVTVVGIPYSGDEYDRSCTAVERNPCKLPRRSEVRFYVDDTVERRIYMDKQQARREYFRRVY